MKRIITIILLLYAVSSAYAVHWDPSVSGAVLFSGTLFDSSIDSSGTHWSSVRLDAELDAAAIRFGKRHTLSLPFSVIYRSETGITERMQLAAAFGGELSLRYRLMMTDSAAVSFSGDMAFLWYDTCDAGAWQFGTTVELEYYPIPQIGISLPFTAAWGRDEFTYAIGAAVRIRFWGTV